MIIHKTSRRRCCTKFHCLYGMCGMNFIDVLVTKPERDELTITRSLSESLRVAKGLCFEKIFDLFMTKELKDGRLKFSMHVTHGCDDLELPRWFHILFWLVKCCNIVMLGGIYGCQFDLVEEGIKCIFKNLLQSACILQCHDIICTKALHQVVDDRVFETDGNLELLRISLLGTIDANTYLCRKRRLWICSGFTLLI